MKHFMLRSLMLLSLLCSTWGVGSAWAQFRDGGVYYFESAYLTGKSLTSANVNKLTSVATDLNDPQQLWEANEVSTGSGGFTLRNLANGQYMKSTNSNSGTSYWYTVATADANCQFSCTGPDGNDTYAMRATNTSHTQHFMHAPDASKVIGWAETSEASRWYIREVVVYDEAAVPGALSNLFSDAACTTLKKEFADEAALTADIDYLKLPEALRNMVKKVYSNTWTENNYDGSMSAWDSDYAKKYRVQLYEPYNDIMKASSALGLNWHTNMNNPTGIFANNGDVLYVMVDGEIEEGASLYLDYFVDGERLSTDLNHGTPLQPGLNIITCTADKSNYCINYVVETFDVSNNKRGHDAKNHRLSDYEPLKIHIEGGYINGYWNKMGDALYPADKNADWEYLEARANQKELLILGQYMTLQFPLKDEDTEGNTGLGTYLNDSVNVEAVIKEWDNIMMWERLLLGVLGEEALNAASPESPYSESDHVIEYTGNDSDFPSGYGDYYNIHGLAWGVNHNFMYATGDMSAYHYNTMGGIFQEMPTSAGSHWGPAHEIGHQHQNLINMRGEMEVSNNLFSNVVLWMYGETTSRVNGKEGSLENILKNFYNESGHYLTNSGWGATQMYYKLFLYYHVLGHNPKFYPRLFEILRLDPQKDNNASAVNGANAQLHLYKKVCEAAGEDLTEFFRAHGFFKPLDGWTIDDYGVSTYYMTQAQIDAAIAEVKAQAKSNDWKENTAVLFINDATGESILSHRDDVEYLELYGETTICAEVGGYSNFNNNATNYTYTISGNTVKMEGEGGVGFAVFNEKGEIVAFSNNKTFEISAEAAAVIASGKGSIVTINGNSTTTPTTNAMESADAETQHKLLGQLLADVQTLIELEDATGKKVGFYKPACVADLKTLYDEAKAVYDAQNEASYAAAYSALYQESVNLQNNDFARNGIVQGNSYRLTNKNYPTRTMGVGAENVMYGLESFDDAKADLWYIEKAEGQNKYYLKNKLTELYAGDVQSGMVPDKDLAGAYAYQLREMGPGVYAFQGSKGLHCSTWNEGYKIVGWGADSPATQWYITAVDINEAGIKLSELETVVAQTEELVHAMADVTFTQQLPLQILNNQEAYYLSTNACHNTLNNASDGEGLAGLLDDDWSTYFHSDYNGKVSATHYLEVDLGAGNNMQHFKFNYRTRANGNNCPTAIKVEGSADGSSFTEIYTFTAAEDGLPNGSGLPWESPDIQNVSDYRYLRFSVTETENSKKFFVMSSFGITAYPLAVNSITQCYADKGLTEDLLQATLADIYETQLLIRDPNATQDDIEAALTRFQNRYNNTLLPIYKSANSAALTAKLDALTALIAETTKLINSCGGVTTVPETEAPITLSATDATAYPYLSCSNLYYENNSTKEDVDENCEDLLDGNSVTHIHTDYSAAESTYPHYLQVDFGTTKAAPEFFKFTYTTRSDGANQVPKTIVVKGSNDGENFDAVLATFSSEDAANPLPTTQNTTWTSAGAIEGGYRYLRFYVTKSAQVGTKPYFAMAEFGMSEVTPAYYDVTVNPGAGEVDEELLLNTHLENLSAQATLEFANTEAQVDEAIADLQAQYNALDEAKGKVDKSELIQLIETATTRLGEWGTVTPTPNGDVLDVTLNEQAGSVNKDMLRDLYRAIEKAQGVIDNADATQEEVNAEIDALTAQIEVVETAQSDPAKANLYTAIDVAQAAIDSCALRIPQVGNEYTVEWKFETAGDVDKATLIAAYEALAQANTVYNGDASTVSQYQAAKEALGDAIVTLREYKAGYHRTQLLFYVGQVSELIENCKVTHGDLTDSMYEDIVQHHATATTYLTQEFATHEELVNAITPEIQYIEGNIVAWNEAQQSTAKAELLDKIKQMQELIDACTTGEGEAIEYVGDVTEGLLNSSREAKEAAQAVVNASSSTTQNFIDAKDILQGHYDTLEAAMNSTAKAELRAMIAQLAELIEKCHVTGTNIVTRSEVCTLQADDSDADFYISTNATDSEGEIRNLVDGDTNTFFQTKSSVGVEHYLLVDAGENNKLKKFTFSYRPCKSPFPYTIKVYGSDNNSEFTELATFTDLPTTDDQNWVSSEIGNGTAYRYLRFNITKSGVAIKVDNNKELDTSVGEQLSNKYKSTLSAATPQVEYCFAMSDFKLTNFVEEEEDIEILAGTVTEKQWSDAAQANADATTLANTSAVAKDLNDKTDELQDIYDALNAAYGLKVSLTLTDATRDKLLTGIDLGRQTIGTFSARYATLIPDGVTAYYATQEYSGGIVWLTRVETTVLPANQGVILIGEETLVDFYPAPADGDEPADLSLNIFSNTASGPVTAGSRDFILANGTQGIGIYKVKEGITIGKGKAFIRLDAAAATQKLVLRFGGTTTDVDNVPTVILPEDTIYDLSGRRVNEVTKGGVYIVNGKKVFIK